NGQNAGKRAIAIDLGLAEIWLGQRLVNGARDRRSEACEQGFGTLKSPGPRAERRRYPGKRDACAAEVATLSSCLPCEDFIILTDFSRCQGGSIGRVSRGPNCSCLKQPHGFEDKERSPMTTSSSDA